MQESSSFQNLSLIGPQSCCELSPPPEKLNELGKFSSINCRKSSAAFATFLCWENQMQRNIISLSDTIRLTSILLLSVTPPLQEGSMQKCGELPKQSKCALTDLQYQKTVVAGHSFLAVIAKTHIHTLCLQIALTHGNIFSMRYITTEIFYVLDQEYHSPLNPM